MQYLRHLQPTGNSSSRGRIEKWQTPYFGWSIIRVHCWQLSTDKEPTLLHGDLQLSNLGISGDTTLAIDWSLATYGPPELDFVWFLSNTAWGPDEEREQLENVWSSLTASFRDQRTTDLAMIYHAVMGELGFLEGQADTQPQGFLRPSPATLSWWHGRLVRALERIGDLE